MSQIFESLKALISPEMISKASAFLGEKDSKVQSATSAIIPGLLASIMKKGDSNQMQQTLEDAGRSNVLSDIGRVFSGNMTEEQKCVGDSFMHSLLGNKANDFTSGVAQDSGISTSSANKLTSMISTVVAGFLGNKMLNNKMNLSGLLGDLGREKSSFLGMVPNKLMNSLGLNNLMNNGTTTRTVDNRAYATGISKNEKPKKGWGWLTWVIIIALLLLLFFWWRSCRRNDVTMDRVADRTTAVVDTTTTRITRTANEMADRVRGEYELPNGMRISAYHDGAERDIIDYLKSDRFKNASNDDLKKKWFGFDNIRFKFDSTTELMDGSHPQMDNVAQILKAYPDTKVVVGGFADVRGGEAANDKISKERADYVKNLLVQKGISASRIQTEGYGEDFAKHSAEESDRARSEDRTIALRFMK